MIDCVLNHIKRHPEFLKRYSHTSCCDELYFSTIVHPIAKELNINGTMPLRYVSWKPTHPVESKYRPYVMDERDYLYVVQSQAFFCRKVDLPISQALLDMIDKQRGEEFCFDKATPIL